MVLWQPLGHRIRAARYQGSALRHGDGQQAGELARAPRPAVAAQCFCGGAAHLAGRGRRGAWLRPASEIQHRQTPHAFIVPSGVHAVRPDPNHAGQPLAPVDANLHRYARGSAPVQESIWSGLKYEGSLEDGLAVGPAIVDAIETDNAALKIDAQVSGDAHDL